MRRCHHRLRNHALFRNLTPNEILIRAQAGEAIHTVSNFKNDEGESVHLDVENLSDSSDIWQRDGQPRLSPPLRLGIETESSMDPLGGKSGAIFPFVKPDGYHGFSFPGQEMDIRYNRCVKECTQDEAGDETEEEKEAMCKSSCATQVEKTFDLGNYMSGFLGGYMSNGGKTLDLRPCLSWGCDGVIPPVPTARDKATLYAE